MDKQIENRIQWVDIYRGIMIILVVVGHATGRFNSWIYQFHMVAFFFISGYVSKIDKRDGITQICKSFMSIMLPYFTISIFSFFLNAIMNRLGIYTMLFGTEFVGIKYSIQALLSRGDIYSQYLGTFWFLVALFGVEAFQILVVQICKRKIGVEYILISIITYAIGFYLAYTKTKFQLAFFNLDIIFIAQFYFALGLLAKNRKIEKEYFNFSVLGMGACFVIACIVSIWGVANGIVMDLASMNVNKPIASFLVACASIYIIICISKIIEQVGGSKIFVVIGKNSLGIMILHFICFKICFCAYYKLGLLTKADISNVVLPANSSIKLWLPMVVASIGLSLLMWFLLKRVPVLSGLIGQNNKWNNYVADKIASIGVRKKQNHDNIANNQKINVKLFLMACMLIILIGIPLCGTGVVVNDELQARCLSLQGFWEFYKVNFISYLHDGRPMAAIVNSFTMYLGFIGNGNTYIFRTIQLIILLMENISFSIFTGKVTNEKSVGFLAGILSIGFMPIVFEHMAPNAFVGLLGVPFLLLLVSLNLFVDSIKQNSNWKLALSMILFFLAQMSYEAFVTYVVLYILIVVGYLKFEDLKNNGKYYVCPLIVTIVFLVLYVIGSRIFVSIYAGNQIGFESIGSSLKIIIWLLLASMPGFFLILPRYQYLEKVYFDMDLQDWIWLATAVILFLYIVKTVLKKTYLKYHDNSNKTNIYIVLCAISCMVLPSIPLSISTMYQGNVGTNGFLCLPVTHYESFAAIFLISYLAVLLLHKVGKKFYIILAICFTILFGGIQMMNGIFAKEQIHNYNYLVQIEKFMNTEVFKSLDNTVYNASDLYKQQNTLAIHDGYWSDYCKNILNLQIQLNKEEMPNVDGYIYYDGDEFVIVNDENVIVVSQCIEYKPKAIRVSNEEYMVFVFSEYVEDNGLYIYTIQNENSIGRVGYKAKNKNDICAVINYRECDF